MRGLRSLYTGARFLRAFRAEFDVCAAILIRFRPHHSWPSPQPVPQVNRLDQQL
jgi:hypothetical protein